MSNDNQDVATDDSGLINSRLCHRLVNEDSIALINAKLVLEELVIGSASSGRGNIITYRVHE